MYKYLFNLIFCLYFFRPLFWIHHTRWQWNHLAVVKGLSMLLLMEFSFIKHTCLWYFVTEIPDWEPYSAISWCFEHWRVLCTDYHENMCAPYKKFNHFDPAYKSRVKFCGARHSFYDIAQVQVWVTKYRKVRVEAM